jgi:hypothetical protein
VPAPDADGARGDADGLDDATDVEVVDDPVVDADADAVALLMDEEELVEKEFDVGLVLMLP